MTSRKYIFCLALVLGGGLAGCSTIRSAAPGKETGQPLYLYYGYEAWNSAQRYLSTRIHPGEDIFVGGDDYWELKGKIEQRDSHLIADLTGGTGQEEHFYRGEITLEKPFFAQGGIASGGAGPGWFMVSTNSDCSAVLKCVNATLGLTNAPFNHPATILSSPAPANVPGNVDPATGLPDGHPSLDPNTGLPLMHFGDTAPLRRALSELNKTFPELSAAGFSTNSPFYADNAVVANYFYSSDSELTIVAKAYDSDATAAAGQKRDQGEIQAGGWNKKAIIEGVHIYENTDYGTMYFYTGHYTFKLMASRFSRENIPPLLLKVGSTLITSFAPPAKQP